LDIYDKLVEVISWLLRKVYLFSQLTNIQVYFRSGDWEAVLIVLHKIDECSKEINLFRGVNLDEVSNLKQKLWMTTKRVQCYRFLNRASDSKKQVEELKNIVDRREELWTGRDRSNELHQNLRSMVEHSLAESADSEKVVRAGNFVFRLQSITEEEAADGRSSEASIQAEYHERALESVNSTLHTEESGSQSSHLTTGEETSEWDLNNSRAHDRDADDLYLITNPWMRPIMELMDSSGGTPVAMYYEFQIPPGRIGGQFFYQSRAFMIEAFLRTTGVLDPSMGRLPADRSVLLTAT
jgi:hypothetical protein